MISTSDLFKQNSRRNGGKKTVALFLSDFVGICRVSISGFPQTSSMFYPVDFVVNFVTIFNNICHELNLTIINSDFSLGNSKLFCFSHF